jgi:uncharacterized protein YodC (DUF2158 family)
MTEPNSPREAVEQHRAQAIVDVLVENANNFPGAPRLEVPPRFKVGDVVVLRSGGPRMTVWSVSNHDIGTVWFVGDLVQRDGFDEAELEFAPPKETP